MRSGLLSTYIGGQVCTIKTLTPYTIPCYQWGHTKCSGSAIRLDRSGLNIWLWRWVCIKYDWNDCLTVAIHVGHFGIAVCTCVHVRNQAYLDASKYAWFLTCTHVHTAIPKWPTWIATVRQSFQSYLIHTHLHSQMLSPLRSSLIAEPLHFVCPHW